MTMDDTTLVHGNAGDGMDTEKPFLPTGIHTLGIMCMTNVTASDDMNGRMLEYTMDDSIMINVKDTVPIAGPMVQCMVATSTWDYDMDMEHTLTKMGRYTAENGSMGSSMGMESVFGRMADVSVVNG